MAIRPLHDWVVVEPDPAEEESLGGIILPDTAKEAPERGVVIAVGEGKFVENKEKKGRGTEKERSFVPTTVKPGDHVMYEKYGVRKISIDGKEWVLVREEDVLGHLISA